MIKTEYQEVVEHIKKYLEEELPQYTLVRVTKKSKLAGNHYLFMVAAKKTDGTFAAWTCWNESTRSLNYGHYNLRSEEECKAIFEEFRIQ